jgi:hydroxymethylpyrimidine pyrophosphatase-like HAD family hydrolase
VKLSVIALDYDGTVAFDDRLDAGVRDAIAAARRRGITVLLVTGRILDELRRVAGDLHFADMVVAENGAVLHVPDTGRTSLLAPLLDASFVQEVRRSGLRATAGQCLVDADANDAPRLLDIIRRCELPLTLVFNRSRVMVLPQGISKGTGLQAALHTLRLSPRNTVAIGDAENDFECLRLAEVGLAVEWGSAALRAAADGIVSGSSPAAVGGSIEALTASGELPAPARARRRLLLGYTDAGREFSLAVRGRNVLVTGDPNSGKSWVGGLLCEQLILHGYSVCAIDPEGDYGSLEALPGVTVLGGDDPPPRPRDLVRALRHPDRSVVIDLSRLPHWEKMEYIRGVLPALNVLRRRTGLPHRILLDEAHYYLTGEAGASLLDFERNGYTVITYRASQLPEALLAATEVMLVTCESDAMEAADLRRRCGTCKSGQDDRWAALAHLRVGQAIALPVTAEAEGELRLFTLAPRLTPHVRHRHKYVDVPVGHHRAFVFPRDGFPMTTHAGTLRQFVTELESLPPATWMPYVLRHDFSRWIDDVFGDNALAAEIRSLEDRHAAAASSETAAEIAGAIRARYDLLDDEITATPPASAPERLPDTEWPPVTAR